MSKLILHELSHSPFCIPVRRILEAHGRSYERVAVPAWDRRELARLTGGAYYQVPVLEDGGRIVHETPEDPLAVARHLDAGVVGGSLFPTHCAGLQELVIGHIEDTLEGLGFRLSDPGHVDAIEDLGERVMVIRHKERKLGVGCVERWREEAPQLAAAFEAALAPYELRLGHSDFLFGDEPVYADYALFGVLGNAQGSGDYTLGENLVHLQRWEQRIATFSAV